MTENEMAGWHHRLNGHEFEQTPEVGDGPGSLVCCSPWGCIDFCMAVFSLSSVGVRASACVHAAVCDGYVVKELAVSGQTSQEQ